MSSVHDICTLANDVIIDPIQIDLVSCVASFSQGGLNSGDSRKKHTFQQLSLYERVSFLCHTSFLLLTLITK
jgi:hypothetical protein